MVNACQVFPGARIRTGVAASACETVNYTTPTACPDPWLERQPMYFPRLSSDEGDKKIGILDGFPMSATLSSLPTPVTQKAASASPSRRRQKKKARFGVGGYWDSIKRRFGSVSSPSLSSSDIRASSTQSHNANAAAEEVPGDPDRVRGPGGWRSPR
jgi:hypothetical protein